MIRSANKRASFQSRRPEALETRDMLSGHSIVAPISSLAHSSGAGAVSGLVSSALNSAKDAASSAAKAANSFTASLADPADASSTASLTVQTGKLLGVSETVITITGDASAAGTSVPISVNGNVVGNVAIDSAGKGTLIVPTASLGNTLSAGLPVMAGTLTGSLTQATPTNGHQAGLTATLTDPAGGTTTANVNVNTAKLFGLSETIVTVTGDASAAGTTVPVTVNGTTVGSVAIGSNGFGILIVPTASITPAITTGGAVSVGGLTGTLATVTSNNGHHDHDDGLAATLADPANASATANVTLKSANLLGVSETAIKVTGDLSAAGTTVSVMIGGTAIGNVTLDANGNGVLVVPTANLGTTASAGTSISVGSLTGALAPADDHDGGEHHGGHHNRLERARDAFFRRFR